MFYSLFSCIMASLALILLQNWRERCDDVEVRLNMKQSKKEDQKLKFERVRTNRNDEIVRQRGTCRSRLGASVEAPRGLVAPEGCFHV